MYLTVSLVSPFFFGVRSNILTSIILVTVEQLCHRRGANTSLSSCVTPFFSKSPQKNKYNHEKTSCLLLTSENSKGIMKHQRSCVERHYIRCSFDGYARQ